MVWLMELSHELAQNCDRSTVDHVLAMFPSASLIGNDPCVHRVAVPVGSMLAAPGTPRRPGNGQLQARNQGPHLQQSRSEEMVLAKPLTWLKYCE